MLAATAVMAAKAAMQRKGMQPVRICRPGPDGLSAAYYQILNMDML